MKKRMSLKKLFPNQGINQRFLDRFNTSEKIVARCAKSGRTPAGKHLRRTTV